MFSIINKKTLHSFDWINFIITTTLAIIGLFFITSATYMPEQPYSIFFKKQLIGLIIGIVIYIAACCIDLRTLMKLGYFAYFATVILLCITIIKGSIGMGAQRWINLGIIKLQPSELCKLFFPMFVSYYFYTQEESDRFKKFMPIIGMLLATCILILKQPDLGTAIIILLAGLLLLMQANLPIKWIMISMLCAVTCMPIAWHMLKPYQQQRVLVFLGHGDAQKERYQIEQSKIAIGSGGLYGKGYQKGTQNIFQFLPESRTDFIFAIIAEEWGFVGALFVLILFLLLMWRIQMVIATVPNQWIQLLAFGISLHITLCVFINISMVLGMLPIVGIPLPLISYGLSNLWVVLATLGILNNIAMHRFDI